MSMDILALPNGTLSTNSYFLPLSADSASGAASGSMHGILVDPASTDIVDLLKKNNAQVLAVVLTHAHFDHIMGLGAVLKSFPAVPVGCHIADKALFGKAMSDAHRRVFASWDIGDLLPLVENLPGANVALEDGASLDVLFSGTETSIETEQNIRRAASAWRVMHTPGHTEGGICLFDSARKLLVSGDTLFSDAFGRTDLVGGDMQKMRASLHKLFELDGETKIYPGHGTYGTTISQAKRYFE